MLCFGSRVTGARQASTGVVLLLAWLLVGCGSRATDSGSEAAATLGVPAGTFEDNSQNLSEDSRRCILTNTEDPKMGVIFTVNGADSVKKAAVDFAQFRNNVGVAVGAIGESGQKIHDIPGLGDEALWTPVPGGVYLRKGPYSVQVNMPASEEAQIKIARQILGE